MHVNKVGDIRCIKKMYPPEMDISKDMLLNSMFEQLISDGVFRENGYYLLKIQRGKDETGNIGERLDVCQVEVEGNSNVQRNYY